MLPDPIIGTIHMYGVMVAIGLLCCFGVLSYYSKLLKIDQKFSDFVFYNGIFAVFAGFGSAALFQAFYDFIEDPSQGFRFNGGITFIGGLIGGTGIFLLVYWLMRKRYTTRLIDVLDIIPCGILIAHAFGRVGCFFAGCCHGKETDCFLGVQFPRLPAPVHPTQLYEAVFLFAMFGVCSWLLLKKNFKYNMSLYLIAYGIFRFFNEFLRGDYRGTLLGFISPSQFWSILMIGLGVGLIFILNYLREHDDRASQSAEKAEETEEAAQSAE